MNIFKYLKSSFTLLCTSMTLLVSISAQAKNFYEKYEIGIRDGKFYYDYRSNRNRIGCFLLGDEKDVSVSNLDRFISYWKGPQRHDKVYVSKLNSHPVSKIDIKASTKQKLDQLAKNYIDYEYRSKHIRVKILKEEHIVMKDKIFNTITAVKYMVTRGISGNEKQIVGHLFYIRDNRAYFIQNWYPNFKKINDARIPAYVTYGLCNDR